MNIAQDKIDHFKMGLFLSLGLGAATGTPEFGLYAAILAGALKELWDMTGRGTPEVMDLAYTIAGGLGGFLVVRLMGFQGL